MNCYSRREGRSKQNKGRDESQRRRNWKGEEK